MPRLPIDYSNSIIYKIVCKDPNIKSLYVGSTTNFSKRKNQHKFDCNKVTSNNYIYKIYQFIRSNGGWDNWEMVMIEQYKCESKLELLMRERYWLDELHADLNSYTPIQTKEERKEY